MFIERSVAPRRLRRLARRVRVPRLKRMPVAITVAALVIVESITACTLTLISHESDRRAVLKNATVLADVRSFMTQFTTLDPFNANEYVERVMAHATGEFAKQYQEKANLALFAVAKGEPTTGTILDAGVERWNDDGSANVLVAVDVNSKAADGKKSMDVASRWLVTAQKEGDQWKISSLIQVI